MNKTNYFTGWAFDVYPDASDKYYEEEIDKQLKKGANYIWIGHNNPGEAIASKDEPALSYAVYEALFDKNDARHKDAQIIVESQKRFLDICLKKNIPVVFPIGYQIQMGEIWNKNHPKDVRTDFKRIPLDVGHVSASIYSEQYWKDIKIYYEWIRDEWVIPYKKIMLLINLADEPFGGDYSQCAEEAFRKHTGLSFEQAANGSVEQQRLLGIFQSDYVVQYAKMSAELWEKICPGIPSTMSFCGHHGRDENTLPSVPELFRNTPKSFYPTFDVYPRDGTCAHPVTENDVAPLLIFLRQMAYLSSVYNKPYWLWTTGNSWGLAQACEGDKANISDCLANQFYAASTSLESNSHLQGIAVWNYNIRNQGLYDDPNPIIYNPDKLFEKVTGFLKVIRELLESPEKKDFFVPPKAAIYLSRQYSDKVIGKSKQVVNVRSYNFEALKSLAKKGINIIEDNSLYAIDDFLKKCKLDSTEYIIYLSDGSDKVSQKDKEILSSFILKSKKTLIPENIHNDLKEYLGSSNHTEKYHFPPIELSDEFIKKTFHESGEEPFINITLGEIKLLYNLSKKPQKITKEVMNKGAFAYFISLDGAVKASVALEDLDKCDKPPVIEHHEIAFIAKPGNPVMQKFLACLK